MQTLYTSHAQSFLITMYINFTTLPHQQAHLTGLSFPHQLGKLFLRQDGLWLSSLQEGEEPLRVQWVLIGNIIWCLLLKVEAQRLCGRCQHLVIDW